MQKLLLAIKAAFPDLDVATVNPGTKMAEIPGWDSMNAINLVLEIESAFGCSNLSIGFSDETTFGEICTELRAAGLAI